MNGGVSRSYLEDETFTGEQIYQTTRLARDHGFDGFETERAANATYDDTDGTERQQREGQRPDEQSRRRPDAQARVALVEVRRRATARDGRHDRDHDRGYRRHDGAVNRASLERCGRPTLPSDPAAGASTRGDEHRRANEEGEAGHDESDGEPVDERLCGRDELRFGQPVYPHLLTGDDIGDQRPVEPVEQVDTDRGQCQPDQPGEYAQNSVDRPRDGSRGFSGSSAGVSTALCSVVMSAMFGP